MESIPHKFEEKWFVLEIPGNNIFNNNFRPFALLEPELTAI